MVSTTCTEDQASVERSPSPQAEQTASRSKRYRLGGVGKAVAASIAGLVVLSCAVKEADASPIMTVDYSDAGAGYHQYNVRNTSPDESVYEMDEVTLPAGSNHGVNYAEGPGDWSFVINLDNTVFNTYTAPIFPDGGEGIFYLGSTDSNTHEDYATAKTGDDEQFNPASTTVPGIPEPSTLAILALGMGGLLANRPRP